MESFNKLGPVARWVLRPPAVCGVSSAAWVLLIVSALWRFSELLNPAYSFLCAPDFVNHLQSSDYWFSGRWYDAGYPPLIPVLLRPFLWSGFEFLVYKVLATSFIALVGLEVYFLIKQLTASDFFSTLGFLGTSMSGMLSDLISFGGIIRLAGVIFALGFAIAWGRYLVQKTSRRFVIASVMVLGVMASHLFVALVFGLSLVLYFFVDTICNRGEWSNNLRRLFFLILPSLIVMPYYVVAATRFGGGEAQPVTDIVSSTSMAFSLLNDNFHGLTLVTILVTAAALLGIFVESKSRGQQRFIACMLASSTFFLTFPYAFRPQMPLLVALMPIIILSMSLLSWSLPLISDLIVNRTRHGVGRGVSPLINFIAPLLLIALITVPTIAFQGQVLASYSPHAPQPFDINASTWLAHNLAENESVISVGLFNGYWYEYFSHRTTYKSVMGQWWRAQDFTFESEIINGRDAARVVSGRYLLESKSAQVAVTPSVKSFGPQLWTNLGEMHRMLSLDSILIRAGNATHNSTIDLVGLDWLFVEQTATSMSFAVHSETIDAIVEMQLEGSDVECRVFSSSYMNISTISITIHPVGAFSIASDSPQEDGIDVTLIDSQFSQSHAVAFMLTPSPEQNSWVVTNDSIFVTASTNEVELLSTLKVSMPVVYQSEIQGGIFHDTTTSDLLKTVGAIIVRTLLLPEKYEAFIPFVEAIPTFNLSAEYHDSMGNAVVRIFSRHSPLPTPCLRIALQNTSSSCWCLPTVDVLQERRITTRWGT
ncbi:MAG: hypothetical protein HXY34_04860 [Candidatus Thorarchaeota archaeon]|nr:hypothetical protein [Candidatus Thorarchaeota archaeon]